MRVLASAALAMLVSGAPAGAGQTCLPCTRTWFEGTVQGVPVAGDGGHDLAVATGDLNRDGRADIAAADGTTFVLLANSDGVFRRGPDVSPGNASKAVGIADMDGDGFLDVVAGGLGIGVTRGNGLGGFLNTTSQPVGGAVHFFTAAGDWRGTAPFALEGRQLLVLQTAGIPEIEGMGGSLTIAHDGPHGALAGKAVAIEPATGFSFDSPLTTRPR